MKDVLALVKLRVVTDETVNIYETFAAKYPIFSLVSQYHIVYVESGFIEPGASPYIATSQFVVADKL